VTDKNWHQYSPSIAIDRSNNIHVVWEGKGWGSNPGNWNIQYRKRTSSGWQAQEGLTDKAVDQQFPNLIWALHPTVSGAKTNRPKTGYAFVWKDGTTALKFYKSNDLDWDTPLPPAPDTLYVGYPSAQSGSTNPTDFAYSTPFFSAINRHGEAITAVQIQLTTSDDTTYSNPIWDSGDIPISDLGDGSQSSVANNERTPDIFYGMGNPPSGILEAGNNYIWRIRTKATDYSDWSENGTIGMTTGSLTARFYSGTGDGMIYKESSLSWNSAHDASIGDNVGNFDETIIARSSYSAGWYRITRGFLPFNTSLLPDDVEISSASLNLYVSDNYYDDNDSDAFITVVQTSQASISGLILDDFDQCGAITNPTEGATRKRIENFTTYQYNSLNLNTTGISWINKTGWTKLGVREGHDVLNHSIEEVNPTKNLIVTGLKTEPLE